MRFKIFTLSLIGVCKAPEESVPYFKPCKRWRDKWTYRFDRRECGRDLSDDCCPANAMSIEEVVRYYADVFEGYSDCCKMFSNVLNEYCYQMVYDELDEYCQKKCFRCYDFFISIEELARCRVRVFGPNKEGEHDCYRRVYNELNKYCQNKFFGCYDFCYLSNCILHQIMESMFAYYRYFDGSDTWYKFYLHSYEDRRDAWRAFYSLFFDEEDLDKEFQSLEERCRIAEQSVTQYHVDLEAKVKAFFKEVVKSQIGRAVFKMDESNELDEWDKGTEDLVTYSWQEIKEDFKKMTNYFLLPEIDFDRELESIGIKDVALLDKVLSMSSYKEADSTGFLKQFYDYRYLEYVSIQDFWRDTSDAVKDFYNKFKDEDIMIVDAVCRASGAFLDFSKKNSFNVKLVDIFRDLPECNIQYVMGKVMCHPLLVSTYVKHQLSKNVDRSSKSLATSLSDVCKAPEVSQEAAITDVKESESRQSSGFVNGLKKGCVSLKAGCAVLKNFSQKCGDVIQQFGDDMHKF